MPPDDADDELLPEIDDDAIVAQQAPAHAPAPRVQVTEEARTIVVVEPPPSAGDTSRLPALARGRNDPTMVIRAVRHPLAYPPGPATPLMRSVAPRTTPRWLPWVIWGIAGLFALLLGGALAFIADRRAPRGEPKPHPPTPTAVRE